MNTPVDRTFNPLLCWLYPILVESDFGLSRDGLVADLAAHGIESKPFFEPLPSLPVYHDGQTYPVADHLSRCGLCLPTSVKLQRSQIETIAFHITQAARRP